MSLTSLLGWIAAEHYKVIHLILNSKKKKTCELVSGYTRPRKMSNNQKCYFNEEKSLFKYDSNLERAFFNGKENQAHLMKRKERQWTEIEDVIALKQWGGDPEIRYWYGSPDLRRESWMFLVALSFSLQKLEEMSHNVQKEEFRVIRGGRITDNSKREEFH